MLRHWLARYHHSNHGERKHRYDESTQLDWLPQQTQRSGTSWWSSTGDSHHCMQSQQTVGFHSHIYIYIKHQWSIVAVRRHILFIPYGIQLIYHIHPSLRRIKSRLIGSSVNLKPVTSSFPASSHAPCSWSIFKILAWYISHNCWKCHPHHGMVRQSVGFYPVDGHQWEKYSFSFFQWLFMNLLVAQFDSAGHSLCPEFKPCFNIFWMVTCNAYTRLKLVP